MRPATLLAALGAVMLLLGGAADSRAMQGRATDDGLLRSDLPPGWVAALLPPLMRHGAEDLSDLSAAQAADVVVDTLLRGAGASSSPAGR